MEAKNCPQIEEELEPKWEKPKTTSDTKSKNLLVLLMKTENQVPKFGNTPTTINTKTVKPKFFLAHNRRTDLKKMTNTVKLKIPMPPSLLILRY